MTIVRSKRKRNFTVLDNQGINDDRLSWEALGLLVFLLSKPDNWQISFNHLMKMREAGRYKLRRILGELKDAGYLERRRTRGEGGKFEWRSIIHEKPVGKGDSTIGQKPPDGQATIGQLPTDGKPPDVLSTESNKDGKDESSATASDSREGEALPEKSNGKLTKAEMKRIKNALAEHFADLTKLDVPESDNSRAVGKWWIPLSQLLARDEIEWNLETAKNVIAECWRRSGEGTEYKVVSPRSLQSEWEALFSEYKRGVLKPGGPTKRNKTDDAIDRWLREKEGANG